MQIPIEQLAAFADGAFSGNPAAVCVLEAWLPDTLLQAIARENNLSETAFVLGDQGVYHLRWFTPSCEVDLCGHATLAAAQVLFQREPHRAGLTFATRSGRLHVERDEERALAGQRDWFTLDFPAQPAEACATPTALTAALGVTPMSCHRGIDWMVVLASEQQVQTLTPNLEGLAQLEGRGVIVTARSASSDFVSRFFAPRIGIPEDPVTGSAHCMLAPYWAQQLGKQVLTARQLSARGGSLHCKVAGDRVRLSGRVIPYLKGVVQVPDPEP